MKALVVVAHHDDAVLWMGGAIHHLKTWDWHIISICNQGSSERKRNFEDTCCKLAARADAFDFLDYQDGNQVDTTNSITDMTQTLMHAVESTQYDYVFTHSLDPNGEYGRHANHHEVCSTVRSLASENRLVPSISRLAHFCYFPIYRLSGLGTAAKQDADYYFQLSYSDLVFKAQLIRSFALDIVNNLEHDLGAPCPNPEAFTGDQLILPAPFIGRHKQTLD